MIINSVVWKKELLHSADRLEKEKSQRRWTDHSAFMVERDIMIGAYAVRKLMEAPGRLTDQVKALSPRVVSHRLIAPTPPDWWAATDWWELYDMESPIERNVSLRFFCNLIVHSFVFAFEGYPEDEGLAGVFVNSEYESEKALFFISTDTFVKIFRAVGNDVVNAFDVRRDTKGRRVIVNARKEDPRLPRE